jgi:hypothetical protein
MMLMFSRTSQSSWMLLVAVPFLTGVLAMSAVADRDHRDDEKVMTGVWRTKSLAGWVVQTEVGVFRGDTRMRWELEEDENGLISGFNLWLSPSSVSGQLPAVGAMCMVGARKGSNVVITESRIRDRLVPTFEFECKHRKGDRARCVGNGFASQPPVALTGRMTRKEDSDEDAAELPVGLINAVRTFCSVGGQILEIPPMDIPTCQALDTIQLFTPGQANMCCNLTTGQCS